MVVAPSRAAARLRVTRAFPADIDAAALLLPWQKSYAYISANSDGGIRHRLREQVLDDSRRSTRGTSRPAAARRGRTSTRRNRGWGVARPCRRDRPWPGIRPRRDRALACRDACAGPRARHVDASGHDAAPRLAAVAR